MSAAGGQSQKIAAALKEAASVAEELARRHAEKKVFLMDWLPDLCSYANPWKQTMRTCRYLVLNPTCIQGMLYPLA